MVFFVRRYDAVHITVTDHVAQAFEIFHRFLAKTDFILIHLMCADIESQFTHRGNVYPEFQRLFAPRGYVCGHRF